MPASGTACRSIFHLALITKGQETTVQKFDLPANNNLDIPIQIGKDAREVILVVTGTTRFTHQKASYTLSILPKIDRQVWSDSGKIKQAPDVHSSIRRC